MRHFSLKDELRSQLTCARATPPLGRGCVIVTSRTHTLPNALLSKDSSALNWNTDWIQQPTSGGSNRKQAKAESDERGSKPGGPVDL